ncbi:hypothetical protein LX64_04428 [Chitinophaga skermanii]|uniref:Uncharacterized protein n=1 Tax=Chitinophaga skermanii TaxID=331697 RepID=A0A327Q7C8_9BACT|nr:hypothetical protein [Chitinophaga skermanii]RAI99874.1 hypothetical protein LX64_04428 [Chitinophaga skermanii]
MGKVIHLNTKKLERVSFYPTKNGFITYTTSRKTINWEDSKYDRIRAHRQEFGRAAQTAADMQFALKDVAALFPDNTMYRRLSSQLLLALKNDTTHERGNRTVEDGDIQTLANFEFNQNAYFRRTCMAKHSVHLDRQQGLATLTIPAFDPSDRIRAPKHTTHFKMVMSLHAINFDTNDMDSTAVITQALPINTPITNDLILQVQGKPYDPRHMFVSIGIVFIEMVNEREYKVRGGYQNAMTMTAVYAKQATTKETTIVTGEKVVEEVIHTSNKKVQIEHPERLIPPVFPQNKLRKKQGVFGQQRYNRAINRQRYVETLQC